MAACGGQDATCKLNHLVQIATSALLGGEKSIEWFPSSYVSAMVRASDCKACCAARFASFTLCRDVAVITTLRDPAPLLGFSEAPDPPAAAPHPGNPVPP